MRRLVDLDIMPRFAAIYAALQPGDDWRARPTWLRFAARAAVLCPLPPADTAQRIRAAADVLRRTGGWLSDLASPWRFVLAALLVQDRIEAVGFAGALPADHQRFCNAGLRQGGMYETMAIAILRHLSGGALPEDRIVQTRLLYDGLKGHHWWLTGPDDLPACACLTAVPAPAEELIARIEANHARLRAGGFTPGNHLLHAACLLALPVAPDGAAAMRFTTLAQTFAGRGAKLWHEDYDAVALLCLLDHPPALVADRVATWIDGLQAQEPGIRGQATFNLAADLALLDLARSDRQGNRLPPRADLTQMLTTLHLAAAGTLLLSISARSIATTELLGRPGPSTLYPLGEMIT